MASASSSTLFVSGIKLVVTAGSGGNYYGNWVIDFDSTKTVRALKPLALATTLTVDDSTPTAAKILGCMNSSSTQAWQPMTPVCILCAAPPPLSRKSGATYTNMTNHSILVITTIDLNQALKIYVNGAQISSYPAVNAPISPSFLVPSGATYSIDAPGVTGTGGIISWSELR
jgi:hypothetical protein